MRPPVLIALHDDIKPGMYTLEADICVLGRYETCQVIVPGKAVSRIHATIERNGPHCFLSDANSANGTYVNGRRIREKQILKDQDEIGLGSTNPLLRFDDSESTTPLRPRLDYDEQTMEFFLNNKPVKLAPNEFHLLHYLYQHAGDLCLYEKCAEAVWQRDYDPGPDDEGLYKLVTKIRKKFRSISPEAKKLIVTRHSLGFQLDL